MKIYLKKLLVILCVFISPAVYAGGVYQEPADFINEVFDNNPPKAEVLWLDKDIKEQIVEILDHKYKGLRVVTGNRTKKLPAGQPGCSMR